MAKLTVQEIQDAALAQVLESPGGIRYSELHRRISSAHPETPANTIHGALQRLEVRFADQIEKPSRGVYRPTDAAKLEGGETALVQEPRAAAYSSTEADFYLPFAEWLVHEHEEATVARPLGGCGLSGKWGTPDVVGVYKPVPSDHLSFPKEIISAEIKIDPRAPIVAFGQATSYRLFSTKSYLVLPKDGQDADLGRVEALAVVSGVGLVVFDVEPSAPNFQVRVRAQRLLPDMFYANEFAHRLSKHNRSMFNELFA